MVLLLVMNCGKVSAGRTKKLGDFGENGDFTGE